MKSIRRLVAKLDNNQVANIESEEPVVSKQPSTSNDIEVLQKVSTTVEGLVDELMLINKNKDYSKLIKLLQSVARLSDENISSIELLK